MEPDEAMKVASVLAEVDGGCGVCAAAAARDMGLLFPDFDWYELVAANREDETAQSLRDNIGA